MCGIFFYINYETNSNKIEHIKKSFNKSKSRGPDNSFFELINQYKINNYLYKHIYIGFHRLSINGLNQISNQPFIKNDIYLICNGEIYNYKNLYKSLNISQSTNSDCEIIIDLYLYYSTQEDDASSDKINYWIKLLDGVFSFVLFDMNKNIVIAARDPFGVRPMFCDKKYTCFSSELKQINELNNFNDLIQFPPGHFCINNLDSKLQIIKYFTYGNINLPKFDLSIFSNNNFYNTLIKNTLIESVKKRLLSDRKIGCLLSGGLDSSLITAIVSYLSKKQIDTFSIGLENSPDIIAARKVAKFLDSNHHELIVTEDEMFNAIPDVIYAIESYDTTTVRASVGNYLISKYISENFPDIKVIFNGDGADEIAGGYKYFKFAPNNLYWDEECHKLLNNIHFFDVLRSDRSISFNGLEPRTPFLDKSFVQLYLSIPINVRKTDNLEKNLIRESFKDFLPQEILYRKKEAFSDGVSNENNSWFSIIQNKLKNDNFNFLDYIPISQYYFVNVPITKEQKYYRFLFDKNYPNYANIIPYFWMPTWTSGEPATDPSARTI